MKIFNVEKIRKADSFTIKNEPVPSIDLMERASRAFVEWLTGNYEKPGKVYVFCGTGNNGGDGLAISRLLLEKNWEVVTSVIMFSGGGSEDFKVNYERLTQKSNKIFLIEELKDLKFKIKSNDLIIDAIFGSGLNKPVKGLQAKVIDFINSQNAPVISVDVPSGVFTDEPSTGKAIVQADHAVSFQFPKLAFMMPENGKYVKNWSIVDIGLSKTFISKEKTPFYLLDENEVSGIIKKRDRFAHKTDFGRLLIVAGSFGKMGAAILAAHACLKSGGGLVTVHIPECGYQIVQSALPEAMVSVDPNNHIIIDLPKPDKYDVIGIGPGIGTNVETYEVLSQLFRKFTKPVVLDADAINIISREKSFLKEIPKGSILTPHPGEFRRLVDFWHDDFERLEMQMNLSQDYGIYIILKGAHTCITTPDGKVFFNTTGNPGMGTAGSGDVLTGILTALLGQGYSSEEACLLGVYLHGLSGDIAAEMLGEECVMAGDIIDYLPEAFFEIKSYKQPV